MTDEPGNSLKLVELVRKLGHDMRSPLGSVISTSDMMAENVYGALTPKQARANERIQRNSRRVLGMLDDFVTYVKAEAGQIELAAGSFDPRASLSDWCNQVKPAAEEKGLALHWTTQEYVPSSLVGDPEAIGRAILPLLWNAVTFTSQGAIHVEADWLTDPLWVISVRDSGTGIRVDDVPHIFEPFWRGEERPQVTTGGAGLGLALSRALITVMKGQLFLKQTGPQGSAFCVELPLNASK